MSKLIRENVSFLKQRVKEYEERVKSWQEKCEHQIVTGKYKSNTGNWDRYDDSYWIEAKCLDCGKTFIADSEDDKNLYYKFSNSGLIESEYESKSQIEHRIKLITKLESERENG